MSFNQLFVSFPLDLFSKSHFSLQKCINDFLCLFASSFPTILEMLCEFSKPTDCVNRQMDISRVQRSLNFVIKKNSRKSCRDFSGLANVYDYCYLHFIRTLITRIKVKISATLLIFFLTEVCGSFARELDYFELWSSCLIRLSDLKTLKRSEHFLFDLTFSCS